MKIKTWLLLTYFIVMLLPLVTIYMLFAWIQTYNDDQKVEEHIEAWTTIQGMTTILENPSFYSVHANREEVEQLTNEKISITLLNKHGMILYSSNPFYDGNIFGADKEQLYQNLYTLKQGYRAFSYKQPVFDQGELIGFFQVEMAREQWTEAVSDRTWIMLTIFVVVFLVTYLTVVWLLNKKLNRRLSKLRTQMTAFANGDDIETIPPTKDEIGELTEHFYRMKHQIEQARKKLAKEQQEKEYMIATISHDLKTPLTSIRAYAESLAQEEKLSLEEREEYRHIIVDKAAYMKQMLDDLLMYTLLQSPTYDIELVEVEGDEFFDMLVSDYEAMTKEKEISLRVFSRVTGTYFVNPKQMIRVVDNIMSNAIQHTPVKGAIEIGAISGENPLPEWLYSFVEKELLKDKDSVYLIVQNSGEDMGEEELEKVFTPLYQVDQARSKKDARGTGLGLSIAKQIVEKHQGEISIYSKPQAGTCVICRIPKKKEGDDDEKNKIDRMDASV